MAFQLVSRANLWSLVLPLAVAASAAGCAGSSTPARAIAPAPIAPAAQKNPEKSEELVPASAPIAARGTPGSFASAPGDSELAGSGGADMPAQPGCTMYAESIPHGIALIFDASSNSPDQVASQVDALAREIEVFRVNPALTDTAQASSFSTRQLAEFSSSSSVSRTERGARLILTAKDPDHPLPLQARVLWQMSTFLPDSRDKSGLCPIVPRQVAEQRERQAEKSEGSRR